MCKSIFFEQNRFSLCRSWIKQELKGHSFDFYYMGFYGGRATLSLSGANGFLRVELIPTWFQKKFYNCHQIGRFVVFLPITPRNKFWNIAPLDWFPSCITRFVSHWDECSSSVPAIGCMCLHYVDMHSHGTGCC